MPFALFEMFCGLLMAIMAVQINVIVEFLQFFQCSSGIIAQNCLNTGNTLFHLSPVMFAVSFSKFVQ